MVEAQHKNSTRKLVDTLNEQTILEQIVDEAKPAPPAGPAFAGLDYLLSTPFRYPPLKYGSRFGSSTERSLWYGALEIETSLAEKAYYQLLFVSGSPSSLKDLSCEWSAFRASVSTARGIDLSAPEFTPYRSHIISPTTYQDTQRLGAAMRNASVEAFLFPSARCLKNGLAIGLFEPVFTTHRPIGPPTTWECWMTPDGCEVIHRRSNKVLIFERADFEVSGRLPSPCVAKGLT